MIEIIKHGNKIKHRHTCTVCACKFDYNDSDLIVFGNTTCIRCPECGVEEKTEDNE